VGAYVTDTMQLAPGASAPQLFVSLNGAGIVIEEIVSDVVSVLVTVRVSAELVVPVVWFGKV
jgi:hypothetical protein